MSKDIDRINRNIKFLEDRIAKMMKANASEKKIQDVVNQQAEQIRVRGMLEEAEKSSW